MFELIRKLFVKDEEIIEKINPDDIKGWFEAKVKVLEEEIENKLVSLRHKLLERIKSTRETLKKLECAELRNPKISTRELQFMYGNKRSYLQRTDFFLKEIGDIIDYEIGFFLIHYKEYVDNFLKSTSKSYRILQEFFANEVRDIAIAIKDLDKVVNELKADEKIHSYNQIEKIKKELISVENKISKKEELAENINAMKEELSGLKEGEDVLMKRRGQILSSDEHTAFLDIEDKSVKNEKEIKVLKDSIYSDFSLLERPLRKYQRIAYLHDKLVEHYSTDVLNALVTDFNLKIVEILKGLSKNIKEGKLVLKDKKSWKVLNLIGKMDKKYFDDFLKRYNTALNVKEKLNLEIKENRIRKELDDIDAKIDKIKTKERTLKSGINASKDELDSIDIDYLRDKVRNDISESLKVKIEFV